MELRLSCADFAWPLLPHERVLDHIRGLDIEAVDLGIFAGRSHLRPEVVRQDVPGWASLIRERLERAQLQLADVFLTPGVDLETMSPNNPDPADQAASKELFSQIVDLAARLDAPGITLLPGTVFPGDTEDGAIERSARGLRWRVEEAAARGLALSVEGHVGSDVDSPEKLARLLELTPGLTLTLDYCHYTYLGYPDREVEPLLAHSRHLQCRAAAEGQMQVRYQDNAIDYGRVVEVLSQLDYRGYVGLEYVWMEKWDCDRVENTMETIQLRDLFRSLAGQP